MSTYDKYAVKESLEPENIYDILEYFGAEPEDHEDFIICRTICHNGDSHKLYYYKQNQLFKCYTKCQDAFDIFELVQKVKQVDLNAAIFYVVNFCNLQSYIQETEIDDESLDSWKMFNRSKKNQETKEKVAEKTKIVLPEYEKEILNFFPQPRILGWEKEGISKEVCDFMNIRYDPINGGILIPHVDENNRLVGIRERTLVKENEIYGKYRPFRLNNQLYNHPLAFSLYGLYHAKENIRATGVALVFESEKAVLQTITMLGLANNIAVAVCGSSISKYQIDLLKESGAREICIGFDRDFKEIGDDEYYKTIERLQKIYDRYNAFSNFSFLFDKKGDKLEYKMSPTDAGKEKFLYLWKNRVFL